MQCWDFCLAVSFRIEGFRDNWVDWVYRPPLPDSGPPTFQSDMPGVRSTQPGTPPIELASQLPRTRHIGLDLLRALQGLALRFPC